MGKRITEINRNKNLHERAITVLAAFGAVIFMAMAGTAAAEDKVRWKMYSPFPPKIPLMGNGAVRLTTAYLSCPAELSSWSYSNPERWHRGPTILIMSPQA